VKQLTDIPKGGGEKGGDIFKKTYFFLKKTLALFSVCIIFIIVLCADTKERKGQVS
jgi:hypothetical protein